MNTGRSSQTTRVSTRTACCGTTPNVVALSSAEAATSVELVRCTSCGVSAWHVEGLSVGRERALAVLADSFAASPPRTAPRRPGPPAAPRRTTAPPADTTRPGTVQLTPAAPAPTELADLLAGWQVFGTTS